jgi:hypothetical protein
MTARNRKYTPEQLEAEIARPKKIGGRPRKYATEEDKKKAHLEACKRYRRRKKNAELSIVNDSAIAIQRRALETDEKRRDARLESSRRCNASHLEEHRLSVAVSTYRTHH